MISEEGKKTSLDVVKNATNMKAKVKRNVFPFKWNKIHLILSVH